MYDRICEDTGEIVYNPSDELVAEWQKLILIAEQKKLIPTANETKKQLAETAKLIEESCGKTIEVRPTPPPEEFISAGVTMLTARMAYKLYNKMAEDLYNKGLNYSGPEDKKIYFSRDEEFTKDYYKKLAYGIIGVSFPDNEMYYIKQFMSILLKELLAFTETPRVYPWGTLTNNNNNLIFKIHIGQLFKKYFSQFE